MSLTILGIRHHGPGSARSVVAALEALRPATVLIEGPPDADSEIATAALAGMSPPLALLVHRTDNPRQAVFYPFAEFSPEWQAIRWALANGVPVRFMDFPWTHRFALLEQDAAALKEQLAQRQENPPPGDANATPPAGDLPGEESDATIRGDPLAWLARADGYSDSERWWNDRVEERADPAGLFTAILEAMTAVRTELALPENLAEQRREAWMRRVIRETQREVLGAIAVVCGAWHAPALANTPKISADNELLKNLPRCKVGVTWVPWTYQRLCFASGYGAGIASPGWYEHLWNHRGDAQLTARWLARVSRVLRSRDLDASTAQVIDGVRLAEHLAAFRGRPIPGLPELNEAALAVLCHGDAAPLQFIARELIVGNRLGEVPEGVARVPLQQDIEATQKRLRLKPAASQTALELDLREDTGRERSHFLHRLLLLEIPWGQKKNAAGGKGTFKELWQLEWKPEFAVAIIDAARHGNTVASAAAGAVVVKAATGAELEALCGLLETTLLADLPDAGAALITRIAQEAARGDDTLRLARAVPGLARLARYGSVRQTDSAHVVHILDGFIARVLVGCGPATAGIDDDAAAEWHRVVREFHAALVLFESTWLDEWRAVLRRVLDSGAAHPLIGGAAAKLLFDSGHLDAQETARVLARALSRGEDPARGAAWLEGFLTGQGAVLIHDPRLLPLLETWVAELSGDAFTATLPLLRRTFSTFAAPERGKIAERIGRAQGPELASATRTFEGALDLDDARVRAALPIVLHLLGKTPPAPQT